MKKKYSDFAAVAVLRGGGGVNGGDGPPRTFFLPSINGHNP